MKFDIRGARLQLGLQSLPQFAEHPANPITQIQKRGEGRVGKKSDPAAED